MARFQAMLGRLVEAIVWICGGLRAPATPRYLTPGCWFEDGFLDWLLRRR
ncbi:MAG: hypothetical protein L0Z62_08215 [Gemmataceae bacterium]|nr:hypothetical protein [Gemmataceae bacterium]